MKNILCFGDSNTFGFNPQNGKRFDKNTRWTGILQEFCAEKYHIIEAGCNNRTAFCDNPTGNLYTGYKILPELLRNDIFCTILAIGINDLQFQYDANLDDIKNGITNLVKIVKEKSTSNIILVSPTQLTENVLKSPIFSTLFDNTSIEKSNHLAKIYEQISIENNCDFIDLNLIATPSNIDGLHFEPTEHKKIANEIYKHILAL